MRTIRIPLFLLAAVLVLLLALFAGPRTINPFSLSDMEREILLSIRLPRVMVALLMGMAGLGAFFWALKRGQFEDLEGAANRILIEDEGPDAKI